MVKISEKIIVENFRANEWRGTFEEGGTGGVSDTVHERK